MNALTHVFEDRAAAAAALGASLVQRLDPPSAESVAARTLARHGTHAVSEAEIQTALLDAGYDASAAIVHELLRACRAFVPQDDGRWRLGRCSA